MQLKWTYPFWHSTLQYAALPHLEHFLSPSFLHPLLVHHLFVFSPSTSSSSTAFCNPSNASHPPSINAPLAAGLHGLNGAKLSGVSPGERGDPAVGSSGKVSLESSMAWRGARPPDEKDGVRDWRRAKKVRWRGSWGRRMGLSFGLRLTRLRKIVKVVVMFSVHKHQTSERRAQRRNEKS